MTDESEESTDEQSNADESESVDTDAEEQPETLTESETEDEEETSSEKENPEDTIEVTVEVEESELTESEETDDADEDFLNEDGTVDIEDDYDGELKLVGTVHVSETTRERVVDTITDVEPEVVAIELDDERLYSMFERGADVVGGDVPDEDSMGFQDMLRKQQEQMFDGEGVLRPGEADMLPATNTAAEIGSEVALIDMPVEQLKSEVKNNAYTDGRLDLDLFDKPIDEIIDAVKGFVRSRSEITSEIREKGDISAVIERMENAPLSQLKEQFEPMETLAPEVVDALIDERDQHMAGHLHWLRQEGHDVVAVMGRGHLNGVYAYLNNPEEIPEEYVTEPDWYSYTSISIGA